MLLLWETLAPRFTMSAAWDGIGATCRPKNAGPWSEGFGGVGSAAGVHEGAHGLGNARLGWLIQVWVHWKADDALGDVV